MHWRPLAQHHRVVRVDQERDQNPDVAAIDTDARQDFETAAADDNDDAGQRDGNADGLRPRQVFAKYRKGPQSNK